MCSTPSWLLSPNWQCGKAQLFPNPYLSSHRRWDVRLQGERWLPCYTIMQLLVSVCVSVSLGHGLLLSLWPDKSALLKSIWSGRTQALQPHNTILCVNWSCLFYVPLEPHFSPFVRQLSQRPLCWFVFTVGHMNFSTRAALEIVY